MSPRPLTRQESQARTRARLIQTAERVFLRRGYHGASIEQIARSAGYTTGAVYSNFANKEELGLAVLERRMITLVESLQHELAGADATPSARLGALERWWNASLGDEQWVVLATELVLASRGRAAIRKQFGGRLQAARTLIAALLDEQMRQLGIQLPIETERIAAMLLGLGIGLSIQRAADPDLPLDTIVDALGPLFDQSVVWSSARGAAAGA